MARKFCLRENKQMGYILWQTDPVNIFISHFFKIHFKIITAFQIASSFQVSGIKLCKCLSSNRKTCSTCFTRRRNCHVSLHYLKVASCNFATLLPSNRMWHIKQNKLYVGNDTQGYVTSANGEELAPFRQLTRMRAELDIPGICESQPSTNWNLPNN